MAKSKKIRSSPTICLPALIYLVIGLTDIAAEIVSFVNEHVKTNEQFLRICVKIIVIFLITIGINLLCVHNLFYLAIILTVVLCIYLIFDTVRILYKNHGPSLFLPPVITKPIVQLPPNQIISLRDTTTYDQQSNFLIPNNNNQIIGLIQ
jgi:hypothetical protein